MTDSSRPLILTDQLAEHLTLWLANTRRDSARALSAALLDPDAHGPLADPEFVIGLVAHIELRGGWTRPKPQCVLPVQESTVRRLTLIRDHRGDT
jgi:hypothetical protein